MDKSSLTSWRVSLKVFKITAVVVVSYLVVPFVSQLNAIWNKKNMLIMSIFLSAKNDEAVVFKSCYHEYQFPLHLFTHIIVCIFFFHFLTFNLTLFRVP